MSQEWINDHQLHSITINYLFKKLVNDSKCIHMLYRCYGSFTSRHLKASFIMLSYPKKWLWQQIPSFEGCSRCSRGGGGFFEQGGGGASLNEGGGGLLEEGGGGLA